MPYLIMLVLIIILGLTIIGMLINMMINNTLPIGILLMIFGALCVYTIIVLNYDYGTTFYTIDATLQRIALLLLIPYAFTPIVLYYFIHRKD